MEGQTNLCNCPQKCNRGIRLFAVVGPQAEQAANTLLQILRGCRCETVWLNRWMGTFTGEQKQQLSEVHGCCACAVIWADSLKDLCTEEALLPWVLLQTPGAQSKALDGGSTPFYRVVRPFDPTAVAQENERTYDMQDSGADYSAHNLRQEDGITFEILGQGVIGRVKVEKSDLPVDLLLAVLAAALAGELPFAKVLDAVHL